MAARLLSKYPVTSEGNLNPASYLKLALMDKELRDTPPVVLVRKLDESIAFHAEHGHGASGAALSRLRYPRMFHVGRAEIDNHLEALDDYFGGEGYNRSSYLKNVFGKQVAYPRVFSATQADIWRSGEYLARALGPFGLQKAAWGSAIVQHPQLVLRSAEELDDRLKTMWRLLDKHKVPPEDVMKLYAANPKLFARDPSSVTERAEAFEEQFGKQGITVLQVVRGMQVFPAIIRTQTEKLIANVAGMQAYLEEERMDAAPYFKALGGNLSLSMVAPERQRDNHRLITASYSDGLLATAADKAETDPRVLAFGYSATLAHSGEDIALRRIWARLCGDERHTHAAFFKTRRTVIESDLRSRFGEQADLGQLVRDELQGLEARLGVTFDALTYGDLASAKRTAPQRSKQAVAAPV